ncbi:hypothetical protein CYLTODRAFT_491918 [Cylindrobasidium torrendii FP15055 ss-10]|uniref:Dynactin subunit 2 n=1 Tax=Cylindrobasidium torrendii FP15055 ss-10 TaxID=1314674 RepID=A0A0D7B6V4_9AGAR|nr:hypothetical protein CYLTODRAFT_491918 [Cylindrobasidium torrendii FP15055 ss-10]
MSAAAAKYANLPDIDTAPDVYESEDPAPVPLTTTHGEEPPTRKNANGNDNTDELDTREGPTQDAAREKFRKAERRAERMRTMFEGEGGYDGDGRKMSVGMRLKALQAELSALEADAAVGQEDDGDAGELIRGLVDVRSRLSALRRGRGSLVAKLTNDVDGQVESSSPAPGPSTPASTDAKTGLVGIDERVAQLERVVGSSTASLDELTPLPPPLVPLITRLNAQLTLLAQPRHIDSISRRLKLLLSDLDRSAHTHGRKGAVASEPTHQQLLPVLDRLAASVPQIPHILTRLKTLSALHASAADFEQSLRTLEEDQKRSHSALAELDSALKHVETSLEENREVVKTNVEGLESRINALFARLESI